MDYVLVYSLSLCFLRSVLSAEEHRFAHYWRQMRQTFAKNVVTSGRYTIVWQTTARAA